MNKRPLKIGYLWQYEGVGMSNVSASVLHVKAVIEGFEQRGHQVRLVTFQNGQLQWSDDRAQWQAADLGRSRSRSFRTLERTLRGTQSRLHLPFLRLFDSYRFSEACVSALADIDILYERYWLLGYGGLIAAKRLGIPLVLEVNGDLVEEYAHLGIQLSRAQWAAIDLITKLMFKQASAVVPVGETIKRRIVKRLNLDPSLFSVVTNGANINMFSRPSEATVVPLRYAIHDKPVIMFVGGFKPWHGVELLIEAFAHLASFNLKAKLVLVGDGPLRSKMESQVKSLNLSNSVVFTGRVAHTDMPALLSAADVAVIYHRASAAEIVETPLKLFEYMAAGKAIVAPAVPNMERILTNRVTGLLVPPDNPEALAGALVELLEDEPLRSKIGQAAKQEAIEKHSWDRAVSELEGILYDLLDKQKT